ncbi:MAG: hypothetical protein QOH54_4243 [Mycobacterium sp.]|jgi:hypothetical protein|nr:hypothetical protein [Mycobacterium sp.]
MGSKHRRQDRDGREFNDGQFKRVFAAVTAAVVFAAVVSAAVVFFVGSSIPYGQGTPDTDPAPAPQPVSQQGTLVAVSPDSLTARSSDGFARTYQINADTTAITDHGSRMGSAGSAFDVNDEVSILAVIRDGKAIATTVVGRAVSDLSGPPMDSVAALP